MTCAVECASTSKLMTFLRSIIDPLLGFSSETMKLEWKLGSNLSRGESAGISDAAGSLQRSG